MDCEYSQFHLLKDNINHHWERRDHSKVITIQPSPWKVCIKALVKLIHLSQELWAVSVIYDNNQFLTMGKKNYSGLIDYTNLPFFKWPNIIWSVAPRGIIWVLRLAKRSHKSRQKVLLVLYAVGCNYFELHYASIIVITFRSSLSSSNKKKRNQS